MNQTKSILTALALSLASAAWAQISTFTWQGRLTDSGQPASGLYDLTFVLYDAASGGLALGTNTLPAAAVSNGLFTATLDFGAAVFDGNARWLGLAVRTNGAAAFTTLAPRQPITPTPYACFAGSASNLLGTLPLASMPGGVVTNHASGVVLNGLTVSNLFEVKGNSPAVFAGGIRVSNQSLLLGGLTVSNHFELLGNETAVFGGGIQVSNQSLLLGGLTVSNQSLLLGGLTVSNQFEVKGTNPAVFGGGIRASNQSVLMGGLTVSNQSVLLGGLTVSNQFEVKGANQAVFGGGIRASNQSLLLGGLTVSNQFEVKGNNTAVFGGGIQVSNQSLLMGGLTVSNQFQVKGPIKSVFEGEIALGNNWGIKRDPSFQGLGIDSLLFNWGGCGKLHYYPRVPPQLVSPSTAELSRLIRTASRTFSATSPSTTQSVVGRCRTASKLMTT